MASKCIGSVKPVAKTIPSTAPDSIFASIVTKQKLLQIYASMPLFDVTADVFVTVTDCFAISSFRCETKIKI